MIDVQWLPQANNTNLLSDLKVLKSKCGVRACMGYLQPTFARWTSMSARKLSSWVRGGKTPDCIENCCVVRIPNLDNPIQLQKMNNWRPIKIGPILLRMYTKTLAKLCLDLGAHPGHLGKTVASSRGMQIFTQELQGEVEKGSM